ncbi:MAG: hypothetical protein A3H59_03990 [Candidatus Jacksonbacteria bacterium RIFCSPLOWO2_02_FULL_43_9]|nr:MAG: hypothetical protein A3H59_03990 [Candidatus Jacksonbacteria bacterium RIFCSPLOWO2_02_FULL_43_9]
MGGRGVYVSACLLVCTFTVLLWLLGKSGSKINETARRGSPWADPIEAKIPPRKISRVKHGGTVPQTDTGGWGEYPQADERTFVKELCKLAVVS